MSKNDHNIVRTWNDKTIRFRESDGYVSLTDMARATGKQFKHWNENKSTKAYLEALSSVVGIPATELMDVIQGGIPENQGTWAHRKVALRFAQWCNPEFAVWVDFQIDELMTIGKVDMNKEPFQEPQRQLPPERDTINYIEATEALDKLQGSSINPMLLRLLQDRLMDEIELNKVNQKLITGKEDHPRYTTARVRASELGYGSKDIKNGSGLGRYIANRITPEFEEQQGKYLVKHYHVTPEMDEIIHKYYSDRGIYPKMQELGFLRFENGEINGRE